MRHTRALLARQSADAMNYSGKAVHAIMRTVVLLAAFLLQGLAELLLYADRYLAHEQKREAEIEARTVQHQEGLA